MQVSGLTGTGTDMDRLGKPALLWKEDGGQRSEAEGLAESLGANGLVSQVHGDPPGSKASGGGVFSQPDDAQVGVPRMAGVGQNAEHRFGNDLP